MYVKVWAIVFGMLMERGRGLDLFNIRNNGVQSACPRRLWPDNLRDL